MCVFSDSSSLGPDWRTDSLSAGTERAWGEILERAASLSQVQGQGEGGRPGGRTREHQATAGPGQNGRLDLIM